MPPLMSLACRRLSAQPTPSKLAFCNHYSGGLEALGEQGFQGATLAIDEANDKRGLLGRKIEGIRRDDKTDPKTAVEKTLELIERGHVDAICGPVTSSVPRCNAADH